MKTSVLVIDSNAAVQAIIAAALSPSGFEVHCLANGASALEQIRTRSPHAVFVSKSLSDSDAVALCRAIKNDPATAKTIVIVMASGSGSDDYAEQVRKAGADALLSKPFKSNEVKDLLDEVAQKQKPKREEVKKTEASTSSTNSEDACVLVELGDLMLSAMFIRFFTRFGIEAVTTLGDVPKGKQILLSVLDKSAIERHGIDKPGVYGELYQVPPSGALEEEEWPHGTRLKRPLSEQYLRDCFASILPQKCPESKVDQAELEQNEQSLLSARISAHIFERLLLSEPLRQRKWREVAASVGAETLHQCQSWQKE